MKTILTVLLAISLTGCLHNVSLDDTSECWRYGVAVNNTGRMTANPGYPNVKALGYDDLLKACGQPKDGAVLLRGCYDPVTDTIYRYWLDFDVEAHELCHRELGRLHNECNGRGYAITGSPEDCTIENEDDTQ